MGQRLQPDHPGLQRLRKLFEKHLQDQDIPPAFGMLATPIRGEVLKQTWIDEESTLPRETFDDLLRRID